MSKITKEDLMPSAQTRLVKCHFFDSGAFTLKVKAIKYAKKHKCKVRDYYVKSNDDFKGWFVRFMDAYAEFVKEHKAGIDYYATVDVAWYADLTWRAQQYLEQEHGLKPIPIIHYRENPNKWMRHYIDRGYDYLGLGGIVSGGSDAKGAREWTDRCFEIACDTKDKHPSIRLHGFGRTDVPSLFRYPWFSVDSSSWVKLAGYGKIYVPYKRGGNFDFTRSPYHVATSEKWTFCDRVTVLNKNTTPGIKSAVLAWCEFLGVAPEDLAQDFRFRAYANLRFFECVVDQLPEWPWPFQSKTRRFFHDIVL